MHPISRRRFLQTSGAVVAASALAAPSSITPPARAQGARPTATDKKICIGVVGGGFGSTFFWHLHPNSIVSAVADHRPERRKTLSQNYKCDTIYAEFDQLVKDKNIDAVAVFTGAPDHVKHSCLAMANGKHVICAVPACMSLDEAQQLIDCKKKTGLHYMMAETSYFARHTIAARDLYREGRFGDLFYSEVEYNHPITDEDRRTMWFYPDGRKMWRHGFPPMHYPTHATGHLVGITKERLVQVAAHGFSTPKIEGYGKGANRYDNPFNGAVGMFKTNLGHACRVSLIWTGTREGDRASLFGTDMSFYYPNDSQGQRLIATGPKAPEWKDIPDVSSRLPEALRIPSAHGGSHVFLTHEFVTAVLEDREPAINVYEALAMTVPGIIGHQSALKDGETMKIPSFDPAA